MKILETLEDRINQLVNLSIELGKKNKTLEKTIDSLNRDVDALRSDNAKFAEYNAQLSARLKAVETAFEQENKELTNLSEEKSLAKLVVDDLIKSIDALIEREELR